MKAKATLRVAAALGHRRYIRERTLNSALDEVGSFQRPSLGTAVFKDRYNLALLFVLIVFVGYKIRFLDLPFYWDEAWSYAPAVRAMESTGPSLLPGSIAPELSRGHPLMFHFLCTIWMILFGASAVSLHSFALLMAVILLIAVFAIARMISSATVGLASVLIVGLNETFLAQSGLVLPEVMLSAFILLAIYFHLRDSRAGYVLAAFAALMTKESAVVFIVALVAWEVVRSFAQQDPPLRERMFKRVLWVVSPAIAAAFFFILQYREHGWVFFPEHLGMMSLSTKDIIYKLKTAYAIVFEQQAAPVLAYGVGIAFPLLWKRYDRRLAFVVVLLFITAIKVLFGRWPLPGPMTLLVTGLCLGACFLLLLVPLFRAERGTGSLACIAFIFIWAFLGFSSLNFFADRYLLCLAPFVTIGTLAIINLILAPWHKHAFAVFSVVVTGAMFVTLGGSNEVGDCELSYADMTRERKALISYCEENGLYDAPIYGSFMDIIYTSDPGAGYLSGERAFTAVQDTLTPATQYAILTNESGNDVRANAIQSEFESIERFARGSAWCELFRRK